MSDDAAPSDRLSSTLVDRLKDLDGPELRAVRSYVEDRLASLQPTLAAQIETEAAGEVVDIDDRGNHALVCMYPLDGADRPLLYHVTREQHGTGDDSLHWSPLGHVHGDGTCGGDGESSR
ncbi:MAG: hypothetical protein ABEI98_11020 [Halorhabdus sp.]